MFITHQRSKQQWRRILLFAIAGLTTYIAGCNSDPQTPNHAKLPEALQDIVLPNAVKLTAFSVIDQKNAPFTIENFKGKWSLVFFGYTNCPDVCPTTLAEMDDMVQLLKKNTDAPKNTQIVFVTLDPKRDTAAELAEYLNYFNTDFIGLTGDIDKLRELSDPLGIQFSYVKLAPNEYAVNHSSSLLLINPEAQYIARFPAPHYANQIADWFLQIIKFNH
jgi:protein SCO1/2